MPRADNSTNGFSVASELVWNVAELRRVLNGGGVAGDLTRRAIRVEAAAKNFATGVGGGPHVRSGRLRSSITHELGEDAQGIYADVGSNVEYAGWVELGTRRNKAYPYLRPALPAGATD